LRAILKQREFVFFPISHYAKSSSYDPPNASLRINNKLGKFTLWGRNLFDKDYYTRGFFLATTHVIKTYEKKLNNMVTHVLLV